MCKGQGNRVLSNVELILPWNVVEACYTLERHDSTCFFAANDSEGTTSQISLSKLEDHSVKIQVTVTALDEESDEPQQSTSRASDTKKSKSKPKPKPEPESRAPVRHEKKLRPSLEAQPIEGIDAEPSPKKLKVKPKQVNQGNSSSVNRTLTAMWRHKRRRQRHQMLAAMAEKSKDQEEEEEEEEEEEKEKEKEWETEEEETPKKKKYPLRGKAKGKGDAEPAMPILEAVDGEEEATAAAPTKKKSTKEVIGPEEMDLELLYKYGPQMRAYEERKRKEEQAKWKKIQEQMWKKDRDVSMVIVVKGEDEERERDETIRTIDNEPILHVIEPYQEVVMTEPGVRQLGKADSKMMQLAAQFEDDRPSQEQDVYAYVDENEDKKRKFFKQRRDLTTRVRKEPDNKKRPVWTGFEGSPGSKKSSKGSVNCRLCSHSFKDHSYLFRHIKALHGDDTSYYDYIEEIKESMKVMCPVCDKSISSIGNISNHMRQCHPDADISEKCEICDKIYKTPASLKQHIRQRHLDVTRKYKCPQCDNTFQERRGLQDHINCVHETTQVYTCNKCWKVFLTKSRLRRHLYIHGDFRHSCKFCGKGFHIKDNMNKHIRIVHEKNHGKMWKCSYCSKEFLVKGNMTQHIRGIHLKQFPFTCSKCQQGFRRMKDMMAHMERCKSEDGDNLEMFPSEEATPKKRKSRGSTGAAATPETSTKKLGRSAKKVPLPESDEEEEEEDLDEEDLDEEDLTQDFSDEEMLDETLDDTLEDEEEEEEEEAEQSTSGNTGQIYLKANGSEDNMEFQIEQDGMVIPIEVVIDQNDGSVSAAGAEVLAEVPASS